MEFIQFFNLSYSQWIWVILAALCVGISKMGISGALMIAIPVLASIFGGKESTGMIVLMLIIGDVFAVAYYHRHARWNIIKKLLPWVLAGLIVGTVAGNYVSDRQFKILIAIVVIVCLGLLLYTERKGDRFKVPEKAWFYAMTGIASGFATMIGNAAGPIFSIYLLAMGLEKSSFMGTSAWYFFVVNLIKIPLQVLFWNNIPLKTVLLAGSMILVVALGALLGGLIVKRLNEKIFRYIIIGITAIASVRLLF